MYLFRNNLTVMDVLLLEGHGVREHLRVGKKTQGQDGYLRFKVTEALLRHCTNREFTCSFIPDRKFTCLHV